MNKEKLKRIFISVFAIYAALTVSFYFLAGDQIRYRDSRFMEVMKEANKSTEELVKGTVIEQRFTNKVDRLKSVSFKVTTYYRDVHGLLYVELLDSSNNLVLKKIYNVADFSEGDVITLESKDYLDSLAEKNLILRFHADSEPGQAISLLMNGYTEYGNILVNNKFENGMLCFSTTGQELIFTGEYYWYFVLAGAVLLGLLLIISYKDFCKDRLNYLVIGIRAIDKYQFLINQLVLRDFKTKYKRSILGVFWSFLNPLMTMTVQYFVFSAFFDNDTKNYPVYLLIGVICYSFFNEATTMCLTSIAHNDRLITKVYVPKYIFPLSRTISSSVNLGISIVPLLLVGLFTGLVFKKAAILALFFLVCLVVFVLGFGMILATLMVFFRDIQFLWSVICMIWMYATPIFYPAYIIPPKYSFVQTFNPLYQCIKNIRICLIDGISPEPRAYLYTFLMCFAWLIIGSFVFKKQQDKFTLYL